MLSTHPTSLEDFWWNSSFSQKDHDFEFFFLTFFYYYSEIERVVQTLGF